MIIKRIINGKEFNITLSPEEVRKAYYEMDNEYTAEDVASRYNVPEDQMQHVVDRFKDALGCNDGYWDSYWMTLEYVCEDMGIPEREGD
jgi:hypothetical protein